MNLGKLTAAVMAGALLTCVSGNIASAQAPEQPWVKAGTTYDNHSEAAGECPALDWHIVRGAGGALTGIVSTDDQRAVFRVTGRIVEANLHLQGTEIAGPHPGLAVAVNGQLQSEGRIALTLGGLPVGAKCQDKTVYMVWHLPAPVGSGGGG
jgi:hypothetical protein